MGAIYLVYILHIILIYSKYTSNITIISRPSNSNKTIKCGFSNWCNSPHWQLTSSIQKNSIFPFLEDSQPQCIHSIWQHQYVEALLYWFHFEHRVKSTFKILQPYACSFQVFAKIPCMKKNLNPLYNKFQFKKLVKFISYSSLFLCLSSISLIRWLYSIHMRFSP